MEKYLVRVDPGKNQNSYYRMVSEGEKFRIEYGRVSANPWVRELPIGMWDQVLKQKIAEGYIDRTSMSKLIVNSNPLFDGIKDEAVQSYIRDVYGFSRKALEENYSVSWQEVSEETVAAAQGCIAKLSKAADQNNLCCFNGLLNELFIILPRKMKNVSLFLANGNGDFADILQREQSLLDTMSSGIKVEQATNNDFGGTILDKLGLDIRSTRESENRKINEKLEDCSKYFVRAFRVHNKKTEQAYEEYKERYHLTEHYFYHGSRNMNQLGIVSEGLKMNPDAPITGKMFGHGMYFAPRARKSVGYTSLQGSYWAGGNSKKAYLLVFKVAYKNPIVTDTWQSWMGGIKGLKDILPHDALYAKAGRDLRNDEVIIYDERMCTIQYVIELAA